MFEFLENLFKAIALTCFMLSVVVSILTGFFLMIALIYMKWKNGAEDDKENF